MLRFFRAALLGFMLTVPGVYGQADDQIITTYQEALKLNPDDTDIRYKLASIYFERGQLDEAIGQFQAIVKFDPDDAAAQYNIGLIHYKNGRIPEALERFRIVMELTPKDDNLYYVMGMCYLAQQDYDHAVEMMEKAVALNPDNRDARINLANAYANAARYKKAVDLYESILDVVGEDPLVQKNLGSALYNIGLDHFIKEQYPEALDYLVRSLPYVESKFKAHLLAANCHFNLGRYEAAAVQYRKVLAIDRDDPDAQYYLAYCYLRMDSLQLALEHFQEVLRIKPDHSKALKYKAELLDNLFNRYLEKMILAYKAQDYTNAWKTVKRAEALVPDNPDLAKYRDLIGKRITGVIAGLEKEAARLAQAGDYAGSYRKYRELLELDPNRKDAAVRAAAVSDSLDRILEPRYEEAVAKRSAGDFLGALTLFNAVNMQKEDFRDVRDRISFCRARLDEEIQRLQGKAVAAFRRGEYRSAVERYDAILALDSAFTDGSGTMQAARDKWQAEEADRKKKITALLAEGKGFFEKGNYGMARARFADLLELVPDHREAADYLARCEKAVADRVAGLLAEGKKLQQAGNMSSAQKKFAALLNLDPDNREAKQLSRVCRAWLLAREGEQLAAARKYVSALKKIRNAMDLDKGNQDVQAIYRKTVAARQKDVDALLTQAKSLMDAGKLREARLVLEGLIAEYQTNHREARDLLKKIKDIRASANNQAVIDDYYSRGVEHYTRGEYKKAVEMWNRVLELNPDHPKARRNIENARKKLEYLDD